MPMEMRQTMELIRIAAAGGGFTLDCSMRPTEELIRIAAVGSATGARLVFTSVASRTTDELVRIAAAGKGCVQFV